MHDPIAPYRLFEISGFQLAKGQAICCEADVLSEGVRARVN